jgi:hypothetical protein
MVSYATTALWGHTEGKETPQRMLNPGTEILQVLLMGCGVQRSNGIVTSHATTTDPPRQGASMSILAQAPHLRYRRLLYPQPEENKVNS